MRKKTKKSYIKPIETVYKGHRFRSRTEARWAVFFSTLGWQWNYETEGYELGISKTWYLPDFYMPMWDKYIEIKPLKPPTNEEVKKAALLVQHSGKPLLMLIGQPWPGDYVYYLGVPLTAILLRTDVRPCLNVLMKSLYPHFLFDEIILNLRETLQEASQSKRGGLLVLS